MEERKNTGGPAYPCKTFTRAGHPNGESMGMTLRDWFAGQALTGLIQGYATAYGSPTSVPTEVVQEAYGYADTMLMERDR